MVGLMASVTEHAATDHGQVRAKRLGSRLMWWLWIVGPVTVGLIFVLTGKVDQRVFREIEAWREQLGARRAKKQKNWKPAADAQKTETGSTVWRGKQPGVQTPEPDDGKKKKRAKDLRPKPSGALGRDLTAVIEEIGEGKVVGQYELVPKVVYARFVVGDAEGSSDHQSIIIRLAEPGPTFTAKPLPLLDEKTRVPNTGIEFKKDPEFFSTYLVEADVTLAKQIGKWLSRDLRSLLREHGEVWLHVQDRAMALSVYGTIRAEKISALVELAEVFVAEHGADDGPSIFGDADRMSSKEKETLASKSKDEGDEASGDDEDAVDKDEA